jgi:cell wall-associated NlpC family hydrolase
VRHERRLGERAARLAPTWLGVPYRYAGTSPSGFDCSGFTRFVYGKLGVDLPHNAAAQYAVGRPVPRDRLEPGDLVFFHDLGHVGLYVGDDKMIHAPQSGGRVEVRRLAGHYGQRLVGARRLVAA